MTLLLVNFVWRACQTIVFPCDLLFVHILHRIIFETDFEMLLRFPYDMNLVVAFFVCVFVVSNELKPSTANQAVWRRNKTATNANKSVRMERFWVGNNHTIRPLTGRSFVKNDKPLPSKNDNFSTAIASNSNNGRANTMTRIPQVNFYSSIPNALGVIGQGIIWLREISAALGTPIPIWIFTIPFFILGIGLMFMPDLTQLSLPLFYPDGAGEGDPLAAFPPLPNLDNLASLNIVKQATQLLPPNFIMERLG